MKEKPLLPVLRERKRYLVYEVLSDSEFTPTEISSAIKFSFKELFGITGLADAGLIFMDKMFNKKTKRGFVRVSHTSLDKLKGSFVFIDNISGKKVILKSVIASGMIDKAKKALII